MDDGALTQHHPSSAFLSYRHQSTTRFRCARAVSGRIVAFSFVFVAPKQLSWRSKTPPVVSIASGVRCEAAAAAIVVPPEKEALVEKLQYQAEVHLPNSPSWCVCFRYLSQSIAVDYAAPFVPITATTTAAALVTLLAGYTTLQVSRLLDLIVHSLYSHKEVFLRELVR